LSRWRIERRPWAWRRLQPPAPGPAVWANPDCRNQYLIDVPLDVVDVLDSHRHPHQVGGHARRDLLLLGELRIDHLRPISQHLREPRLTSQDGGTGRELPFRLRPLPRSRRGRGPDRRDWRHIWPSGVRRDRGHRARPRRGGRKIRIKPTTTTSTPTTQLSTPATGSSVRPSSISGGVDSEKESTPLWWIEKNGTAIDQTVLVGDPVSAWRSRNLGRARAASVSALARFA
jgi:hypothetical protein